MAQEQQDIKQGLQLYWTDVYEHLTRYFPNGENEDIAKRLDELEEELYEELPKKWEDPFMGAYELVKRLGI